MLGHSVCLPSPASIETEAASNMNPTTLSAADKRFISTTLSKLKKNKNSLFFQEPVDPIKLGCPDYFEIIKQPMDLRTAKSKLDDGQYESVDAFIADIRLIFYNCHLYNNPNDPVGLAGKKLEEAFDKCLLKRPSAAAVRDSQDLMPDDEFRHCEGALKEMKKKKHTEVNWAFLNPVDANAWGAIDYYDVIKRPMDLSTIEKKLNEFQYSNEDEFVDDVRLMFQNCYKYNQPEHPVHTQGKKFEKIFDSYWKKAHETPSSKAKKSKNHAAERPEKVKEEDAIVSQKRTSDHLDDDRGQNNTTNTTTTTNSNNNTNKTGSTILRLKLSVTNHNETKKPQQEQVSPPTPTSSSSIASSSAPALSSQSRLLAISKEPPPPPQTLSQPRPLALSASKPAANKQPPSSFTSTYLNSQRRPSEDYNNRSTSIPETQRLEQGTKYPAGKFPAGKRPAGKGPASKYPTTAGKQPKQSSQSSQLQQTTPISPPANIYDIDSLFNVISNENKIREQERKDQQRANEEKHRTQKQMEMRKQQEEERAQKDWQERTSRQKQADRKRRMEQLNASSTIDISKHKLSFSLFERQLHGDPDWRELLRWQRDTVDYRHLPTPGFIRRRSNRGIADVKSSLLSTAIRFQTQYNGAQEREDDNHEQDMDVE